MEHTYVFVLVGVLVNQYIDRGSCVFLKVCTLILYLVTLLTTMSLGVVYPYDMHIIQKLVCSYFSITYYRLLAKHIL